MAKQVKKGLAAALSKSAGKPTANRVEAETEAAAPATAAPDPRPGEKGYRVPSRRNKRMVTIHLKDHEHMEMYITAIQSGLRLEQAFREAANLWLESKGKQPLIQVKGK